MTILDIRCHNHLHHRVEPSVEPSRATVYIFCAQCSRKRKEPVFHQYTWEDARAAQERGTDVLWVDREMTQHTT